MEDEWEDALSVQQCMGHNKTHKTSMSQKAFLGHISTFMFTLQRLFQRSEGENKEIRWHCFGNCAGFDDGSISEIVPLQWSTQPKSQIQEKALLLVVPMEHSL